MIISQEILERFSDCMDAAVAAEEIEPTAMTLATHEADSGRLSARMVLLKSLDENGFVFYTNTESLKGRQLAISPQAALVFYWKRIHRQVRVEGRVEPVSEAEADAYFATRPRGSQLGAWASAQSEPLDSRLHLVKNVVKVEAQHVGRAIPRPPFWSGYRVVPEMVEFWYGRTSRLHDRFLFTAVDGVWERQRLYP